VRISLLQLNFQVGDLDGNASKIISVIRQCKDDNIDLFVTSELAIFGYPPRDLLFNQHLVQSAINKIKEIAQIIQDYPPLLLGGVEFNHSGRGKPLYNSCYFLKEGQILQTFQKTLLPNYDVFDELRYFESAQKEQILELQGKKIGLTICEDIWNNNPSTTMPLYQMNPAQRFKKGNVDLVINLSSSPFSKGKQKVREAMLLQLAQSSQVPVIYVNQVGGNDDLVFDGRSCAFDKKGKLFARAEAFKEEILTVDLEQLSTNKIAPDLVEEREIWEALVLGTGDYLRKCGFSKAVLGLSGGIDSALTAIIAAEALGVENVESVLLPSPYSSQSSVDDALELTAKNGLHSQTIPIADLMESFRLTLLPAFEGCSEDTTEENIQARIRGNLLMALSNKYNALLLTTGNKSELAVGYCTIYGDMSGGLAVIADLPKTLVYRLCRWINLNTKWVIPENIITKLPSAELRPDQTDQDTLPPYDLLDTILYHYIEKHRSADQIIKLGFEAATVRKIVHLIKIAEFKRKQAAPGIKITDQAFGTGWRMPIAAR
jgi:NAD+ synthetase